MFTGLSFSFPTKRGFCLRTSGATGPLSRQTPTDDPLWQLVALAAGTGGHVDPVRLKHPVRCCRCGNLSFLKACEIRGTTDFSSSPLNHPEPSHSGLVRGGGHPLANVGELGAWIFQPISCFC